MEVTVEKTLDRRKVRKLVESALEKYRIYLLSIPEYKLPKITATYTFVPKGPSEPSYSGIENAVIEKVDYERERFDYINMIQKAVNRLSNKERQLIIRRYMLDEDEDTFDYEIYNEMGVSESHYYKVKRIAFDKLAILLGIANDI